jgi:hypothetical protein
MITPSTQEPVTKPGTGNEEIIINQPPEVPVDSPDEQENDNGEEHTWVNPDDLQALHPDDIKPGEEYLTGI